MSGYSNNGPALFLGDYANPDTPLWASYATTNTGAANLQVSSLTVNSVPAGNVTLTSQIVEGNERNAPLLFQRPVGDVNGAYEGLVMNKSLSVPTYPTDGEFITASKAGGLAYDDIAVKGLQVFGSQTTMANGGAAGYITGDSTGINIVAKSLTTSSINVSSIFVGTVVSTTSGTANTYRASLWMSTPVIYTDNIVSKAFSASNVANINPGYDLTFTTGAIRGTATTSQIALGAGGANPQAIIRPSNINILSVSTNNISTGNLYASSIRANVGIYSTLASDLVSTTTLKTGKFYATAVSSANVYADFMNVSRVTETAYLSVTENSFFRGNVTGNEPDTLLLWNGSIKAVSTIITPSMYIYNGISGAGSIDNNNDEPYGVGINSDAFQVTSVTDPTYIPIATSINNVTTRNLIEQNSFASPAVSTNNISTNNLYAGQTYVTTGNYSTLNSRTANISTANISSVTIGNFSASQVDANTISSLSSRVSFSLVSTLQLNAKTTISPNINLGLGDVIQGLIGGAATQALGVTVGTVGLATGATALITGRTSGGAAPGTFQVVNGQTQLQFSTIGTLTPSIYQTTDSLDPTRTPGNLVNLASNISSGTYCVRSISDPLNVDSATQGIQSFGQWVPVVQSNATFPALTISSLTTSSFVTRSATISSLTVSSINSAATVAPSTLFASTINYVGALIGTNPRAPLTWPGPATFPSTSIHEIKFIDNLGNQTGRVFGAPDFDEGINMIAPNGFLVQNATNATARFNPDRTTSIYSTLFVQDVVCYDQMYVSTLNASTINAEITLVIPSTLQTSSIRMTGALNNANSNAYLTWAGSGQFKTGVESQGFLVLNTTLAPVSIIRAGLDNNVVFDYNAITFRGAGGSRNYSTLALKADGTASFASTLRCVDQVKFGNQLVATPYISTNVDNTLGSEGIFFGGSTMTLKSDYVMRLEVGAGGANPFLASLYDAGLPTQGVGIQIQGGPMNFQGLGIDGPLNYATFNLNAQFNRSTIMKGPYNGVSTMAISTLNATRFTNNLANISSLTVSSIQTPTNGPIGVPPGCIMNWAGGGDNFNAAPPPIGWLLCDGRQYPTATYPDLYAVIGTTYNRYTPTLGYFFVPDLRFTFPMAPPTFTTSPTAMVNAPVITFYTQPTNLGIPGVAANQIWTIVSSRNGVLVPGMYFGPNTGPNFQPAYIKEMIDGTGDVGSYIMGSLGTGTWPAFGSVGSPVTQTVVGVGQGQGVDYSYKIGTINATGFDVNPGYVNSNDFYRWGFNINGSNVGIPGSTPFVNAGIMNTYASPVSVGGIAFPTAPNFMNILSIIKY